MAKNNQIQLPMPNTKGKTSLEEIISKRRSERAFIQRDLNLGQISQLLWAAQGVTLAKSGFNLRAAPSAGALYPMEIYLLTRDGLFHYLPELNKLDVLKNNDLRKILSDSALGQNAIREAAVDIVICAVYSRVTKRYGQRGARYVDMEAGHIAQNIHLQTVALGLGSVSIGAFDDKQVKGLLSLPDEQELLYIIPVGYTD